MRQVFIASAAAAALAASAAMAQSADDARAAIEERNAAFEAAFNSGDSDAVAELYTEDAMILPPDAAQAQGRDAIGGFWGGAIEAGVTDLDLTTIDVETHDDIAVEVGARSP